MQAHQFDLVLMDEASQCEVARALPVLLRGGQVALAGDEQQLQPLDLFAVRMEEAWYSEEDDPALETASILALGKLRCPTVLLNWHYRSRQSELIAFSNQHFYSKRLQPVPLPEPARSYQPAIQLHYVAGHWAAGQNAVEADELVRLVKALLQHPQQPSIGVITLNRSQRELVLERLADQHILAGMASNESPAEETLFVRNLEHVQGDERDVILISLGYAPDQQGRFKQHFGLLNQAGGENRLNVILTRARWQLHIVHSFRPEQLQVAESAQPGPRYLQTFLQQAQQGGWADSAGTGTSEGSREETTNTIATALAQAVEQLGYRVVLRPGPRQLGLDFAVYSAHNPDRCLLGVLCEGPRYFAGRSPAERSIYRYQALVARGWPLHTVYVRNYWQAPQAELQRILQKLAAESETSKP
jgi:hypothetical protein